MGERIALNNDWYFSENWQDSMSNPEFVEESMEKVRLPHTCKELPLHYFDEHLYQMVSGYRKHFFAPNEWAQKTVRLTLEGSAHETKVYLNGELIGEHHCGYTAFTMVLDDKLHYGEDNVLSIRVDSRENPQIPPFGYVVDYMTYGGIYREVFLEISGKIYFEDIFLKPQLQTDGKTANLLSEITLPKERDIYTERDIHKESEIPKETSLLLRQSWRRKGEGEYTLLGEKEVQRQKEVQSQKENDDVFTTQFLAENLSVQAWDLEHPVLYEIKTQLVRGQRKQEKEIQEEILDEKVITIGFRNVQFLQDGFYLNGRRIKIRGLNRHQSYPYVGYAMPKSMQKQDADILKYELGVNAVRTSHYPQSHHFLDRCDEIGLLVFTEIPGWQHIGGEAWKEQAVQNTEDMVKQYRNHTSIVLWGVRINESQDDDAFYEKTNAAAHRLDDTRSTGGVRAHKKSSLLEDVYTYNDFVHDGSNRGCEHKKDVTSDEKKPYLISEYNGHMYPTKAFDWEEHRSEHAIRHANVLDAVANEPDIAGSFGWCMADYNTHKDFGSGDRICYHGVMDMFRNPKLAAAVYESQQEKHPVLALSSSMDIGEHPGCNRGKTWIFTNADSVRMYKNERFIKEYTKADSPYQGLAHGAILLDDFVGDAIEKGENFKPKQAAMVKEILNLTARYGLSHLPKKVFVMAAKLILFYHMKPEEAVGLYNRYIGDWGGTSTVYRFEAIQNGKVVKKITKEPMKQVHLEVSVSHRQLSEETTYDVASVRIQAVDENGNLLSYFNEPIRLKAEGAITLLGDEVIALQGGMGGTYVKTKGIAGEGILVIENRQTGEKIEKFSVTV